MANDLVFEVKAEDNATATLDKVQREIRETGQVASSTGGQLSAAGKSSTDLAAGLGKAAAAGVALSAVADVGRRVVDFLDEATQKSNEYRRAQSDLEQAVSNATGSTSQAEEALQEYTAAMDHMGAVAGDRLPEMQQALTDLVTRTGEVAGQGENLQRVWGLMNLTGRESRDVAKSLGEALTGDAGPMKELGILTAEQVTQFNAMEDSGDRVARILEILDQKIEGFAEGLPPSEVAMKRLESAWDRFMAAVGTTVLETAGEQLADLADGVAAVAEEVEEFATAWSDGARSVGDAVRQMEKDLSGFGKTVGEISEQQVGEQKIAALRLQLKTTEMLIEKQVALDQMSQMEADFFLAQRRHEVEERIRDIEYERGLIKDREISAAERQMLLAQQELAVANQGGELAKAQLQADFDRSNLLEKQAAELAKISNESERAFAQQRHAAELAAQQARAVQEQREIRQKMAEEAERRRAAEFEAWDKQMAQADALHMLIRNDFAAAEHARIEALTEQYDLLVKQGDEAYRQVEAMQEAARLQMESVRVRAELDAEESEVLREGDVRDIGTVAGAAGGVSEGLGEIQAAYDDLNVDGPIMRQVELWGEVTAGVGEAGNAIAELVKQQWDFTDASSAALSAIDATVSIAGAGASALAKNKQQEAGILAAFHGAAALGATAFGLTTGAPNYWAAAAKHATSAAGYGLVASGAVGTRSSGGGFFSGGIGGGGGGGGTSSTPNIDIAAEREATARAFADALSEKNQLQGVTINVDLGRQNVIASESDQFARMTTEAVRRGVASVTGLNAEG